MVKMRIAAYNVRVSQDEEFILDIAIDSKQNLGNPICRDYDLPSLTYSDETVTEQHAMRKAIKTDEELLQELMLANTTLTPIVFTGNGNLLANYGYVAWKEGKLYHLKQEPVYREQYYGIVAWKDGANSIEELYFFEELDHAKVLYREAATQKLEDITKQVRFVMTGPPLVLQGKMVPLEQETERFYDTRHLVRPLCYKVNIVKHISHYNMIQFLKIHKSNASQNRVSLIMFSSHRLFFSSFHPVY